MLTSPPTVCTPVESLASQLCCHLELGQSCRFRAPFHNTVPSLQGPTVGNGSPGRPCSCTTLLTTGVLTAVLKLKDFL